MYGLGSRPFHARARFETQDNGLVLSASGWARVFLRSTAGMINGHRAEAEQIVLRSTYYLGASPTPTFFLSRPQVK